MILDFKFRVTLIMLKRINNDKKNQELVLSYPPSEVTLFKENKTKPP